MSIEIGDRSAALAAMRRKPASLLLYLVTRPAHTANREQVFDELWPDTDPGSASNSLNQSLYFLRRELDPWYEDDVSVDYISLQGDLVWLDPALVRPDSAVFLTDAQHSLKESRPIHDIVDLLARYRGRFAPEFEYDEWAMSWRSRVQTAFLELADRTIDRAVRQGELEAARDIALLGIEADPDAREVERKLIAIYWHLGARSAARAQFEHLARQETMDGLEPPTFSEICRDELS